MVDSPVCGGEPKEDVLARAFEVEKRFSGLIFRNQVMPNWLEGDSRFWYKIEIDRDRYEYVLVDIDSRMVKRSESLESLGIPSPAPQQLEPSVRPNARSRTTGSDTRLRLDNQSGSPIELLWISSDGERISYGKVENNQSREQHTYAGHLWEVRDSQGAVLGYATATQIPTTFLVDVKATEAVSKDEPVADPDLPENLEPPQRLARIRSKRLEVKGSAEESFVPYESSIMQDYPYHGPLYWSARGDAFVVSKTEPIDKRSISVMESSPKDQLEPKIRSIAYTKPGDRLPNPRIVLMQLVEGVWTERLISNELFPNPFTESDHWEVRWSPKGDEFYLRYNARGHQFYRMIAVNSETGQPRIVIDETSSTFINYSHKNFLEWLDESSECIWMSEGSGWAHLYLYDISQGQLLNPITTGEWVVREVVKVDRQLREIWFYASGLRPGEDPYHRHLCRVRLDGQEFIQLTSGDGDHQVEFSPDGRYLIDRWSRVDLPPIQVVLDARSGECLLELETADITQLVAAGWTLPERFEGIGRDGKTPIFGIIIKPSDWDPQKSYPVVEEVYAGPHSAHVPKRFDALIRQHVMAELGFVVVQVDGMGTNHRGKTFHDHCWKNLKDAGFPDRIGWIRQAAASRPWMDLARVGIYGGSAGGQSAMRALLDHSDFYHVAVADCGCHDNRMDKIWWNEQWMGWPVDESYPQNSNAVDAHRLQGKLLLIVGELDSNVDPASTYQVVHALQRSNKSFDFVPIIGAGHGAAESPYGKQRRAAFLFSHLHAN